MNNATTQLTIKVPARLEPKGVKGWTVYEFATLADAHTWAARNQDAAMPCWRRAECWGGKALGR